MTPRIPKGLDRSEGEKGIYLAPGKMHTIYNRKIILKKH